MSFTISELIEELQDLVDSETVHPEAEVRLAIQPSYPFEHSLGGVAALGGAECSTCEVEAGCAHESGCPEGPGIVGGLDIEPSKMVYLGEGSQLGFLSGAASTALGWR